MKLRIASPGTWYDEGLRFSCTGCGGCCTGPLPGYVYLDEADMTRLAGHLGLTLEAFGARYLRRLKSGELSLTEKQNRDCIFWSDEGCAVYRVRPGQCRKFPFWPENLTDRACWEEAAQACPGMNQGRRYSPELIARMLEGRRGTRAGPGPRRDPTEVHDSES